MSEQLAFRVRFTSSEADLTVTAEPGDAFNSLIKKIREHKSWDDGKHIRLICAGRELRKDDEVSTAKGDVLHCIATDRQSHSRLPGSKQQHQRAPASVEHLPTEWLDVVDPGTVLMWIFGAILVLLWLLFLCCSHMFDRTSVAMLCMMSLAFVIPLAISYLPNTRAVWRSRGPARPDVRGPRSTQTAHAYFEPNVYGNIPQRPLAPVMRPGPN